MTAVTERLVAALRDVLEEDTSLHGPRRARRTARELSQLAAEAGFAISVDDLIPRASSTRCAR